MVPGAPPPPPTAPYSHAVRAGEYLFVTGQLGADPKTGDRLVAGGIVEQTHQVMRNLQTVLAGAGTSLERAVFARVYLVNFQDYAAMNGVYVRRRHRPCPRGPRRDRPRREALAELQGYGAVV